MIANPADVVLTAHLAHWVDDHPARVDWMLDCLGRHNAGDSGELDADDRAANSCARRHREGRIVSRDPVPDELADPTIDEVAIWIITDDLADPDSLTTVLWPGDY